MAGLLDPMKGDGTWVENRPSKWAQTWGIVEPYAMAPINAWKGLMDADLDTLLYDTGPKGRQAVENAFDVAGTVMGGSSVVPKPDDALNMGIRAYHGSPHDFDRFDMSKIGTGEGAQAYGHGLYFADSEGVARTYRDTLAAKQDGALAKYGLSPGGDTNRIKNLIAEYGDRLKNPDDVIAAESASMRKELAAVLADDPATVNRAVAEWEDKTRRQIAYINDTDRNPGRMYEVNINADPDTFLDWDKPLSEQPEAVRNLYSQITDNADYKAIESRLRDINLQADELSLNRDPVTNMMRDEKSWHALMREKEKLYPLWQAASSGGKFQEALIDQADKVRRGSMTYKQRVEAAADILKKSGIPGIKYLDAGSRGAGDGTRNYVVFDDSLVEILRKYGIAGLLGMGAAGNSMLDQPQEVQ